MKYLERSISNCNVSVYLPLSNTIKCRIIMLFKIKNDSRTTFYSEAFVYLLNQYKNMLLLSPLVTMIRGGIRIWPNLALDFIATRLVWTPVWIPKNLHFHLCILTRSWTLLSDFFSYFLFHLYDLYFNLSN